MICPICGLDYRIKGIEDIDGKINTACIICWGKCRKCLEDMVAKMLLRTINQKEAKAK